MSWEARAIEVCRERGLEVLYPYGFEGGYVFVKDEAGSIFPIRECIVAKWMEKVGK